MAIDVRRLHPHEHEVLGRVAAGVFDRCVQPALAREYLADARHHLVVAIEDDLVVGMISSVVFLHPDKPPQLWINEIGVGHAHQRRGIGRRLVDVTLELARSLGCMAAWLGSEPENELAHRLYERAGGSAAPCLLFTFELGEERGDAAQG